MEVQKHSQQVKTFIPPEIEACVMEKALLIRLVEEALLNMYARGEIQGTIHTCIGQELTGVIVSEFLSEHDAVFSNHRCHGHFLALTDNVEGLIAEIAGKITGVCGGRGGSQHLCQGEFYSNGVQGGIAPVAAGIAWAKKTQKSHNISVVYLGDGTLGEGVVYETFNLAALLELPLLFVLENNQYAQSTHQSETLSGEICKRAESFGIRTATGSTWNWYDLYLTTEALVHDIRCESKPALLQVNTYRLMPHSKGDDNRCINEIESYRLIDPLNIYLNSVEKDNFQPIIDNIAQRVHAAVELANAAAFSIISIKPLNNNAQTSTARSLTHFSNQRLSLAINQTLHHFMEQYPQMIFIGEDVKSPYGGAFKISQGLSSSFPLQVFNMPISEAAIVGLGCGLALCGYRPIVEIMFGDFITLAMDQILNHAAKFRFMYNEQVTVPLIIRTPMGGGRGYGPTHSQTLDRHILGIPGLSVIAINNLIDPRLIYSSLILDTEDPIIMIENKLLYTKLMRFTLQPGFYFEYTQETFPTILVLPKSQHIDVTIIGYGGLSDVLVDVVEALFYSHDIIGQFICPVQIYPYDISLHINQIKKSRFVFIVEEGQGFASFGSEIIAQLAAAIRDTVLIYKRIFPPNAPIPASKFCEDAMLPNANNIIQAILESMA